MSMTFSDKPNFEIESLSSEIARYLVIPKSPGRLYKLSQIFFPCQATNVASKRIFSKGREIKNKKRNCLKDPTIKAVLCLNSWL